jgi:lipoate-protein ligase A
MNELDHDWLLLGWSANAAAWNMAVDEALLEHVARLGRPVTRFYGWTEPAATFGYFQHYAAIEALTRLRPLVRRPTGGGLVPHDRDWTYSVVFPPGHEWYRLRATESYQRLHEWVRSAFSFTQIPTELAPCCRPEGPGQCFLGAEKFDLLWQDRKIAGAAQRRNKSGLLIQGSVQPPPGSERSAWELGMLAAVANFGARFRPFEPDAEFLACVEKLAAEKYRRDEYNQRR